MLVAISGSQGSGKSTLIRELVKKGYKAVERKTSRSVLTDWDVTLDEVNTDMDLSLRFQDELLHRKTNDENEAVLSKDIWFCERTYMDLFVYALINFGKLNEYSDWVDLYYDKCQCLSQKYELVWYLRNGNFEVEHDGVRGSNRHYSTMVDATLLRFTNEAILSDKLWLMNEGNLETRVSRAIASLTDHDRHTVSFTS